MAQRICDWLPFIYCIAQYMWKARQDNVAKAAQGVLKFQERMEEA
jgi:hypothetical protein